MLLADAPFLDNLAADFRLDSEAFRAARSTNWFARTPLGYLVLGYEDCAALLREPRLHQATRTLLAIRGVVDGPIVEWWTSTMLNLDGAEHTRLRRLVAKAFTPPMVERLRPFFRASAERLVDAFAATGRCEFMEAFSSPFPLEGICEMLGIPPQRRAAFSGWAADLGLIFSQNIGDPAVRARAETALAALLASADDAISERRIAPGDDLVSALVAVEAEGVRLTHDELRHMIVALVFAGNDTTRNQLALGMMAFAQHPTQWRKLRERGDLAARAVDEMMRLAPTIAASPRFVADTFAYRDHEFPTGSLVILLTSGANVDERTFGETAFDFDIEAERPAPHLTFSGGIHRCLGLWLAKAELEEALRVLAERFSAVESDGIATWEAGLGIKGPTSLPLRFVP